VNDFVSVMFYVLYLVPLVRQMTEVLDQFTERYGPHQDILRLIFEELKEDFLSGYEKFLWTHRQQEGGSSTSSQRNRSFEASPKFIAS